MAQFPKASQTAPVAVPQLGSCTSLGCAWWLWAAEPVTPRVPLTPPSPSPSPNPNPNQALVEEFPDIDQVRPPVDLTFTLALAPAPALALALALAL